MKGRGGGWLSMFMPKDTGVAYTRGRLTRASIGILQFVTELIYTPVNICICTKVYAII